MVFATIAMTMIPAMTESSLKPMIEQFAADVESIERKYETPFSKMGEDRLRKFFQDERSLLSRQNFGALNRDGQVDYLLFDSYLRHRMRQMEIADKQFDEIRQFVPFAETITNLEDNRILGKALDAEKAAQIVNELKKSVDETKSNIETRMRTETFKRTTANRASMAVSRLRSALETWFKFYDGYVPTFGWWVSAPFKSADEALAGYARFLRETVAKIPPGNDNFIVGDPIGREALLEELKFEMIPYTPEELVQIANKEFAWCQSEMIKASREMGCGDDWKRALEIVKEDHVDAGQQTELVRRLAEEAIKFVEDRDLVTIPELAKETWRMEMMSPQMQLVNPFFLGGDTIMVSYPTDAMSQDQKMMSMRANNVHFSRATVFHELIPGHNLQQFMNARYAQYRRIFSTPFWTEGWALYWEMLMWDLGFPKSPQNRVGMLFWRMHRCARIIFSLGFHLETMTPDQCIELLVDKVGHERSSAEAEVRRSLSGAYPPLYQCAYMLGALQFRSLHHEFVDSKKMTDKQFHDRILQSGNMPVAMIRALFGDGKLSKDFDAAWRFYDLAAQNGPKSK